MKIHEIKARLEARGTVLNPPLSLLSEESNEIARQFKFNQDLGAVFNSFNGFGESTMDQESFFSLWPTSKILARSSDFDTKCVIGDFLIESDFLVVGEDGGIRLLYENRLMAKSISEFLIAICEDKFNL